MPIRPESARAILSRVDPGRMFSGCPVGLRDGALLALLAAGLTPQEISDLRASAVTMNRGNLVIAVHRQGVAWTATLPTDLGGRVLAWITQCRLWAEGAPIFTAPRGTCLSSKGVYSILQRYRQQKTAQRC